MTFESLPTTPTSEELLDKAFSRAARSGRAKEGLDAQRSMLLTASNILGDNLRNVAESWPDFDDLDPFYYELADAIAGIDELRQHLSEVSWAGRKTKELGREYQGRLPADPEAASKVRKQAFARMADIVEEVDDDLVAVAEARDALRKLPDIRPDEPTIVVAGSPNVGKSSFVNAITNARNEVASYPFTTTAVRVGHVERDHIRYQIVDTPGLLDRPAEERNAIERQAASALEHLASAVLVILDPSETCGYALAEQLALRDDILERFADIPVLTVANKADLDTQVDADVDLGDPLSMSITADENVQAVLDAAIDAIGYEPELPYEG